MAFQAEYQLLEELEVLACSIYRLKALITLERLLNYLTI